MRLRTLGLITALALFAPAAHSDEIYTFVIKKQAEKAKKRWYLSDWLETRDRMRLMDLWLALHSPSPYEFFVDGNYQSVERPSGRACGLGFGAAAYASIFGFEVQRQPAFDSGLSRTLALFNVRIFGYHAQTTNITLQGGLRNQAGASSFRNPLFGVQVFIGITRNFGIDGLFRRAFASTPGGLDTSGNRYEAGGAVDFSFLRVYGKYFSEITSTNDDKGFAVGTRVFF